MAKVSCIFLSAAQPLTIHENEIIENERDVGMAHEKVHKQELKGRYKK